MVATVPARGDPPGLTGGGASATALGSAVRAESAGLAESVARATASGLGTQRPADDTDDGSAAAGPAEATAANEPAEATAANEPAEATAAHEPAGAEPVAGPAADRPGRAAGSGSERGWFPPGTDWFAGTPDAAEPWPAGLLARRRYQGRHRWGQPDLWYCRDNEEVLHRIASGRRTEHHG